MKLFKLIPILITSLLLLSNATVANISNTKKIEKSIIPLDSLSLGKLDGIKELLYVRN